MIDKVKQEALGLLDAVETGSGECLKKATGSLESSLGYLATIETLLGQVAQLAKKAEDSIGESERQALLAAGHCDAAGQGFDRLFAGSQHAALPYAGMAFATEAMNIERGNRVIASLAAIEKLQELRDVASGVRDTLPATVGYVESNIEDIADAAGDIQSYVENFREDVQSL